MEVPTVKFSLAEKLAVVQSIHSVILADEIVHNGEIKALGILMNRLDFDSNFILQARNLPEDQNMKTLNNMSVEKKKYLSTILDEIAKSDGFIHDKEIKLIKDIFKTIG